MTARASVPVRQLPALREGFGLIVVLALVVLVMAQLSPVFWSERNATNLLQASTTIAMIAAFTTMLMIGGGLDLSVAAVSALTGVVIAVLQESMSIWAAAGIGVLVAAGFGLLNGILVTYVRINPFITTLGTMSVARGLAFVVADGRTKPIMDFDFPQISEGMVAGVPIPLIVTGALFALVFFILRYTHYGRAMYAMGGSSEASTLAGLPVKRYRVIAYMLSGFSAGVAGMFLTARLYAAAPQASIGLELSVIAAVVLGGTSLAGGKGTILGTLLGVLILGVLNNGMTLLSLSTDYQQIIQGIALLLAIGLDQLRVNGMNLLRLLNTRRTES